MHKLIERLCPICDGIDNRKIKNIKLAIPEEYGLPKIYDVVCCNKCGFCYSNTKADNSRYDYYYTNFNVYSYENSNDKNEEKEYSIIKKVLNKFLNKNSKILNIGIGSGQFEKGIFQDGYTNVMGIDPSNISVNDLLDNGIEARLGNIYNNPDKDLLNKFDAVFLQFTLEHLLEPKKAIEQIKKYMSKEGILFISVPNYGRMKYNTTPIPNNFNQEHINYFSRTSLNNLFSIFGLSEVYSDECIFTNNCKEEFGIFQVYKNIEEICGEVKKDLETSESINTYFKLQDEDSKKIVSIIDMLRKSKEEVIVWGTGAYTMNLLENTSLNECNIGCYIDNNPIKEGVNFNGKYINLPSAELLKNKTVLICSMLYSEDIKKQIIDMNVKCKIIII